MTLLLDHAVVDFTFSKSSLIVPSEDTLTPTTEEQQIPVSVIGGNAAEREELHHPDRDEWVRIPLHESNSAEITQEYIIYTEHDLRGELFLYADGNGNTDQLSADEFRSTPLAHRIRYWHADYVPSSSPSYYSSPLTSHEEARNPLNADPSEFFDSLIAFIDDERTAQRESNIKRALSASPADIRSDGGDAIPSVLSHGHVEDGVYRFEVAADADPDTDPNTAPRGYVQTTFGIHDDNEVLLTAPTPDVAPDTFPVRATVSDITRENIYLDCDREAVHDTEFRSYIRHNSSGYGIVGVLNPVPFNREQRAVETLNAGSPFREVFTGDAPLTFTDSTAVQSDQHDLELNQDQQSAVEHALSADRLFCIHGPPGTGKTRTLVEIVRRATSVGHDVLVCADSNRAVDNITAGSSTSSDPDERSLHAHAQHGGKEFTLRRNNVGRSSNVLIRDAYANAPGKADVVASTNGSAATLDRTFDLVVVDEATQATIPSTCIPLSRARRAILAGDHRQLPPYSASEDPPKETASSGSGGSLFEHFYSDGGVYEGVGIPLRTQYRMHRDIAYYPNRRFYDNILETGRSITPLPNQPVFIGYDIGGSESAVRSSTANTTEARLVSYLVGDCLDVESIAAEDIGVITPYTAQKYEIEEELPDAADTVTVDTIDAFQGSEKPVVFISLVRSNGDGRIGFLGRSEDGPRRLNVALTRAQRFCAVIGDWQTLTKECGDGMKCTDLYRSLQSHLDDTGRFRHVEPEFIP